MSGVSGRWLGINGRGLPYSTTLRGNVTFQSITVNYTLAQAMADKTAGIVADAGCD